MTYHDLGYAEAGSIAIVTLRRPECLNALSPRLIEELRRLVGELARRTEIRVVLFTGSPRLDGRPCWSAGFDLKAMAAMDPGQRMASRRNIRAVFQAIENLPKPTIGAIDGVCTAGGLELALVMDIRLASETAEISDLHIKNLGGMGGSGLPARLPRVVGLAKAKEIAWTGRVVPPMEALRIGLVNHVFPATRLMAEALEMAKAISEMSPLAVEAHKVCFNEGRDMSLDRAMELVETQHNRLGRPEARAREFWQKRATPANDEGGPAR